MATRDAEWPLGAVIKAARERAGLSVREAAGHAEFSPTTWTSIETGTRIKRGGGEHEPTRPKPGVIVAAANVVGVAVDTALELAGYDPSVYSPSSSAPLTRSERSVAQRVALLSPEERAAVGSVVDAFLAGHPQAEWPLGAFMKAARERVGLTVEAAAKLAKCSPTKWATLETGTRGAGEAEAGLIVAAANVVDVDVNEALRLAGYIVDEPETEVRQPQFLAADAGPRSRGRLGHPEPARRRGVMSHESGHDEEGRNPGMPEPRPAESRM